MKRSLCIMVLFLFFLKNIEGLSLVYNMKIRRAFNIGRLLGKEDKNLWLLTALPIVYTRKMNIIDQQTWQAIQDKRIIGGALFNVYVASPSHLWAEISTGVEREAFNTYGAQRSICGGRTGIDDILMSCGYDMFVGQPFQLAIYGIGGIPTKQKVSLQDSESTLVGTRFFSLGAGCELSYEFFANIEQSCTAILQNRFLHFFNRKFFPILPFSGAIQPGNIIDILLAAQYRFKKTLFEIGFNPTYFTNQAALLVTGNIKNDNFVRDSVYFRVNKMFGKVPFLETPLIVGAGVNVGWSKQFDTKIFAFWTSISTIF